MQTFLIHKALISDTASAYNLKVCDVLVVDNVIVEIGENIKSPSNAEVIEANGAYLSPGFCDIYATSGEPNDEETETLNTLSAAAMAGGYTTLVIHSNSKSIIDNAKTTHYITEKAKPLATEILVAAAISENTKGEILTEMHDMAEAGAVAFSDGQNAIQNTGFVSRAMLYAHGIGKKLFVHCEDYSLSQKAMVHESPFNTHLGLKAAPALAESIMVAKYIALAEYHNINLHITNISCAHSVALIRTAKQNDIKITADVAINNLYFIDEDLHSFDSNLKVKPPLRGRKDVEALIAGLKDGTIDTIVSQHIAVDIEHKAVEFGYAAYGTINIQTTLSMALEVLENKIDTHTIAEILYKRSRNILNLIVPTIKVGESANLVLFNPTDKYQLHEKDLHSKSKNTTLHNKTLQGKIIFAKNK